MKYSDFYLAFENECRGSSFDVNQKLVFYDDLLQEVRRRFIHCSLLDIGCGRGEWLLKKLFRDYRLHIHHHLLRLAEGE